MKIAIHGRSFSESVKSYIQEMFDLLTEKQIDIYISSTFAKFLDGFGIRIDQYQIYYDTQLPADTQMVFTVGGDGTLLDAITHVSALKIPIMGINTGRLGFLATISPNAIATAIDDVIHNRFEIEERSLLALHTEEKIFENVNFALNDVVVAKTETSSMITVHAYLNGEFLNSYWADGLIISTPTGSTGYSLSCGGPVLLPMSENFVITPLCPHNLNVRPLVVPDNSILELEITSRSSNFLLSLDSRCTPVADTVRLQVRKSAFNARLVKFNQDTFLKTLRGKLYWGNDARN